MKTTDDQTELFTHVDNHDQVIGAITRAEAHAGSFKIHRGVWILVFNDRDELFLQKRSLTKDSNPGMWSMSVGGHVTYGQTYKEAVRREFMEELGVPVFQIEYIRKYHFLGKKETEIGCVYKTIHNGLFVLNPEETDHGEFHTVKTWEAKIRKGEVKIANWALAILQDILGIVPERPEKSECILKIF